MGINDSQLDSIGQGPTYCHFARLKANSAGTVLLSLGFEGVTRIADYKRGSVDVIIYNFVDVGSRAEMFNLQVVVCFGLQSSEASKGVIQNYQQIKVT